jgi:NADH:ubiquinone oxidoreductase subunit K
MKFTKTLLWLGLGLTAFPFAMAGGMKALGVAQMHSNMAEMHYHSTFTYALGLLEILGVVGLFFQRTRLLVLIAFQLILAGGIESHIAAGHGFDRLVPGILANLGILIASWAHLQTQNFFQTQTSL